MTIVEDLRNNMSLREISRVSGYFPFLPLLKGEGEESEEALSSNRARHHQNCIRKTHLQLQESLSCVEERWNESQQEGREEGAERQKSISSIR